MGNQSAGDGHHADLAKLAKLLDDVESKINNAMIKERAKKEISDKEVRDRYDDHAANSQAGQDLVVRKLVSDKNATHTMKIGNREALEMSLARATGALELATQWNKTVYARIEKVRPPDLRVTALSSSLHIRFCFMVGGMFKRFITCELQLNVLVPSLATLDSGFVPLRPRRDARLWPHRHMRMHRHEFNEYNTWIKCCGCNYLCFHAR